MERISRVQLFMEVARLFARRATCLRGQVGAVLIRDKRIIASSYNGPPKGQPHCEDKPCDISLPCTHAIHAEANLIAFCAKEGIKMDGSILVLTTCPCSKCAELIIQSGIKLVIYDSDYRDAGGFSKLVDARVTIYKYNPNMKINWDEAYI